MKQLADFMPEIRQGSVRRDHITVKIVVYNDYVHNYVTDRDKCRLRKN
jgi:hypothetical protein